MKKIRENFASHDKIRLVWDGAPYHRSAQVKQAALELEIALEPLPAYSPDFMPVEHLWQWLREDVAYHHCYGHETKPTAVADRLWTKTSLNSDREKLRFSK